MNNDVYNCKWLIAVMGFDLYPKATKNESFMNFLLLKVSEPWGHPPVLLFALAIKDESGLSGADPVLNLTGAKNEKKTFCVL